MKVTTQAFEVVSTFAITNKRASPALALLNQVNEETALESDCASTPSSDAGMKGGTAPSPTLLLQPDSIARF